MRDGRTVYAERVLTSKQARLILIGGIVLYIALGLFIGYFFVWNHYSTQTRYQQDIQDATIKVQENPNDINARLDLGFSYMKAKQYEQSREEYQSALSIDPNNVLVKRNMAYLYIEMKKYKDADKVLANIAKVEPDFEIYYLQGKSKYLQKDYKSAIQSLFSARDLNPTDTDILYQLGLSYEQTGNKKMAHATFKDALQYDPNRQDVKAALNRTK